MAAAFLARFSETYLVVRRAHINLKAHSTDVAQARSGMGREARVGGKIRQELALCMPSQQPLF